MSVTLAISVSDLTVPVLIVVALSIIALLITGWQKSTRPEPRRDRPPGPKAAVAVAHQPVKLYKRPNPIRRLFALATTGVIGVILGVIIAILISFAGGFALIRLSDMLGG